MRSPARLLMAAGTALVLVSFSGAGAAPDPPPLPDGPALYERLAHASHVAVARVVGVEKRALLEVLEPLRGTGESERIEVAFRSDNRLRSPQDPPMVFKTGQASLFLLRVDEDRSGRPRKPLRYRLVNGVYGKIDLPPEGAPALLQAARRFVEIQDLGDQNRIWEEVRALVGEVNLRMAHAGLVQVVSFRLADDELLPRLLEILQHPAPALRYEAVQALDLMINPVGRMSPSEQAPRIVARLKSTARADESPDLRAAAVRVLGRSARPEERDFFRQVAAGDPSQVVRYEAEVALLDLAEAEEVGAVERPNGGDPR